MKVKMILPALAEALSPLFRPIKYSLFPPPLGLATLAGYLGPDDKVVLQDEHVEPLDLDDEPDLVVIQVYITAAAQKLCDWKRNADRSEKRRRLRRPLLMKVDIDIRARKLRVPGELVDASGAGCRIELKEELAVGDLVRVILHGHEDSTHVALGAEVRWHRVTPAGLHVVGVRFTRTTALLAGKLLGFASTGMT